MFFLYQLKCSYGFCPSVLLLCVALIVFLMLNYPCIPEIHFMMYNHLNVLLNSLYKYFVGESCINKDIGLSFFLLVSLSDFGVRVMPGS